MPRILRNYLISFTILGLILFIISIIDEHLKEKYEQQLTHPPQEITTGQEVSSESR